MAPIKIKKNTDSHLSKHEECAVYFGYNSNKIEELVTDIIDSTNKSYRPSGEMPDNKQILMDNYEVLEQFLMGYKMYNSIFNPKVLEPCKTCEVSEGCNVYETFFNKENSSFNWFEESRKINV